MCGGQSCRLMDLIPQDLLRYVDEGKSPQLFLKECFEKVESSSASQQDTSAGFAEFQEMLLAEMSTEWPEAAETVAKSAGVASAK